MRRIGRTRKYRPQRRLLNANEVQLTPPLSDYMQPFYKAGELD